MTILKQMERINKADKLIIAERTGDPDQLAEQLGISRVSCIIL